MADISERSSINPIRIEYFGDHRYASTLYDGLLGTSEPIWSWSVGLNEKIDKNSNLGR